MMVAFLSLCVTRTPYPSGERTGALVSRRLDSVDFDVGLSELKKFKAAHGGDLLVPQNAVVEVDGQEVKLGRWAQRLRQLHKNTFITPKARAGFGQMTEIQKRDLDAIGFMFELPEELKKSDPVDWDNAFAALAAYHKAHKNTMVPQATMAALEDGTEMKLGKWVQRQRQIYKNTYVTPHARKSFGQMTEEQKGKLEELEFAFEVPEELRTVPVDWDVAFDALAAFKKKNGHTKVPEKTLFGSHDQDLGKWCQRQRQVYKNTYVTPKARKSFGQMSEEQKARLGSLGFNFAS
eukprot:CAMPEP_0171611444 /NCGR_PEP_ID=MMETSP0990-20121206/10639_1 /TAXON_ID=483369 /ORGANISM="non described non described, Strain CCMP2098" /LENGTH=291 /DNA_ID=CAMNT_0012175027 /DNA_START=462 /DNA_END=1337 /DNA_ORIENTATION=+